MIGVSNRQGRVIMMLRAARKLVALVALLLSTNAYCFIDPPTFTPTNPVAGEEVSINVRFGVCDGFLSQAPTVVRSGSTVEITYATVTNTFCNLPPATRTTSIGLFAAGTYAIVVKRNNVLDQPPIVSTVGTYSLVVQQGAIATPVPSSSLGFLIGLTFGLAFFALLVRRRARFRVDLGTAN